MEQKVSQTLLRKARFEEFQFRFEIRDFGSLDLEKVPYEERFYTTSAAGYGVEQIRWLITVSQSRHYNHDEIQCVIRNVDASKKHANIEESAFYFVGCAGELESCHNRCRGELVEYKSIFLPDGALTVQCDLRISYPSMQISCDTDSNHARWYARGLPSLQSNYRRLFDNPKHTDVVLSCDGQDFDAHKVILSARSPVFEKMFERDAKENVVQIEDTSAETVRAMLKYIYCAQLDERTTEFDLQLYTVAVRFDLQDLKSFCSETLASNLSPNVFCGAAILAHLCEDGKFLAAAKQFMRENCLSIVASTDWMNLIMKHQDLAMELVKP